MPPKITLIFLQSWGIGKLRDPEFPHEMKEAIILSTKDGGSGIAIEMRCLREMFENLPKHLNP